MASTPTASTTTKAIEAIEAIETKTQTQSARYFAKDQANLDRLESDAAGLAQALEELAAEHGGEDGLLADAKNEQDKLTKASVAARLKAIKSDKDAEDERKVLAEYLKLVEREAEISATIKAAREELIGKVAERYAKLSEGDVKALVVESKWLACLESAVQGEIDRMSQTLTARVRVLAGRYAVPLPRIVKDVDTLAGRVEAHLKRMGAV